MNKKDLMRKSSLRDLLVALIDETPGMDTAKLWNYAKQWDGNLSAFEFDGELKVMLGEFRVTNKKWYRTAKNVA